MAHEFMRSQIEAYRLRFALSLDARLSYARQHCRICGGMVILPGGVCACCGASGVQRSLHPAGNEAAYTEPAQEVSCVA